MLTHRNGLDQTVLLTLQIRLWLENLENLGCREYGTQDRFLNFKHFMSQNNLSRDPIPRANRSKFDLNRKLPIDQDPPAMNATAIDSRIFRNLFGTEEARRIFSDEEYVSQMIDVETALSRAQATAEVIPHDAAESITNGCNVAKIEYVFDSTVNMEGML